MSSEMYCQFKEKERKTKNSNGIDRGTDTQTNGTKLSAQKHSTKEAKTYRAEKKASSVSGAGKTRKPRDKEKLGCCHHTQKSKWIQGLNRRPETVKYTEENTKRRA